MSISELASLAIRTESFAEDLNGQESQLRSALELVALAGEVLDQVKRKIFYGEKGDYNPQKLNSAAERLASIDMFDFVADEFVNRRMAPMENPNTRLLHGVIGVITESAEMAEAVIKYIDTGEIDAVNMVEEICDVQWYMTILQDVYNFSQDEIHKFLIVKLAARYGDAFSDVAATVRDISSERSVMERFINEK